VSRDTVAKRIGKDGKARKVPAKAKSSSNAARPTKKSSFATSPRSCAASTVRRTMPGLDQTSHLEVWTREEINLPPNAASGLGPKTGPKEITPGDEPSGLRGFDFQRISLPCPRKAL
jgi:hypothetical protein